MRILLIVCVVLVAYTEANTISLDFTQCSVCECKTPQNSSNPVLMVHDTQNDCYCMCGKMVNEPCSTSGECHRGLYCTAPDSETGKGICDDACNKPGVECDTYDQCMVLEDEPTCMCRIFDCSDTLERPICAGNVEYQNRCHYENAQCPEKREGRPKQEIMGHGTCRDVVSILNSEPVYSGNTYNPFE